MRTAAHFCIALHRAGMRPTDSWRIIPTPGRVMGVVTWTSANSDRVRSKGKKLAYRERKKGGVQWSSGCAGSAFQQLGETQSGERSLNIARFEVVLEAGLRRLILGRRRKCQ